VDELSPPEWMDEGPPLGEDTPAEAPLEGMLAYRLSDTGNSHRLVALHGEALKCVSGVGWHYWTGTHWEVDRLKRVQEAAKHTIAEFRRQAERLLARAQTAEAKKAAEAIVGFAAQSENANRLSNMVALASSDPLMARTPDQLDKHPYLLNVANGTVDLRTGELRPHCRADLLTVCAPASLREWAALPTQSVLAAFMQSIQPNEETQAFIWRCIGMSLVGEQRDHVVLFAYGEGGNGKGTLFRAVNNAIGEYFCAIPSDMLVERFAKPHAAETAQLMGKRFAVADELPPNKAFDISALKKLSGGDKLGAQFMRENWFNFTPTHTLWLQGNAKPHAPAGDDGTWRRMHLLPFLTKIPRDRADRDLDRKLDAERDIVLRMAVDGAVDWFRNGLGSCQEVDDATSDYRADEDAIGQFLEECCDVGPGMTCQRSAMRAAIERWWRDEGKLKAPNNQTLKADFAKRGIVAGRSHGSPFHWSGVQLNAAAEAATRKEDASWGY
jgi:putative DNA primase/helicase